MNKSKPNFNRCRPALGTLVRVRVDNEELIEPIYKTIHEIETIFNFHNPNSELTAYNRDRSIDGSNEFQALLTLAQNLQEQSDNAFFPYINGALDLGGIAKGWAVDKATERAMQLDATAKGFIEAGGDVRFFGEPNARISLRLGAPPDIFFREIELSEPQMAVASSSPGMAQHYGDSKTSLKQGKWPEGTSVSIVSSTCAIADALTKVVLFGASDVWKKIDPNAKVFVFDRNGEQKGFGS